VVIKLEEIYNEILQSKNNSKKPPDIELTNFINSIVLETLNYSYTKGVEYGISIPRNDTSEVISMAEKFIAEENYEIAIQILKMFLLDNPNSIDALNDLAVVSILTNKFENALNFINKALTLDSANEIALENFNYLSENFKLNEDIS
jgi:tetratricopeptide (TPR) repeat protein